MIRLTTPKPYECECEFCQPEDSLDCRNCWTRRVVARLGAYEDSGLEPEQAASLASSNAFSALTPGFIAEFSALRKRLAEALTALLKEDPHHKSYEGTWELTFGFDSVFEDSKGSAPPCFFLIKLSCTAI